MALENVPIRRIIERVLSGEIRIPGFQRGFVWTPESVAFLMDSIYRSYPVGALLLWQTRERLTRERKLGPFEVPDPKADWPIEYVLDGQQRITSLFGVFQTDLQPAESGDWFDVYFDLRAPEGALEEQFIPLPTDQIQEGRHFPLKAVFDTLAYREATQHLGGDDQKRVDQLQARFKEAMIPVETITTPEREQVAIIFERVNRAGVPLDTFQLLSAWTWSTEFDLAEAFQELATDVEPFGFGKIGSEPNLLMRCCAAVIDNDASPKAIVNLHGPAVRDRFPEIVNGVKGTIEFLTRELKIFSLDTMPYPAMVVPLAKFFATDKNEGYHPTATQRKELLRWFWRSCFSRRYSSGVGRAHATDIAAMSKLHSSPSVKVSNFPCVIDAKFFLENRFGLASVNTRSYLLLLASLGPRSFISGSPVDMDQVLKACNSAEFHHIFPKRYLTSIGISAESQNVLANVCFLSRSDNQRIGGRSPSEYRSMLPPADISRILESNGAPADTFELQYGDFLERRAQLLTGVAQRLIS